MSINSINQTSVDNIQNTVSVSSAVQSESSSANKNSLYSNPVPNTARDSINISSSVTLQTNPDNLIQFQNQESTILDSNSAKNSVNTILSYIQNNGSQVLNSIRMPCASVVLNLISDSV